MSTVFRNIARADPAAIAKPSRFGAATIHEAPGRAGLLKPYLPPIYPRAVACGSAVTVLAQPGDANRKRLAAGELGLDLYGMRDSLAKAGLRYVDE